MTGLLAAEFARLRARRVVWIAALVGIVLLGAFQIAVNAQVTPPSAAQVSQYEQDYNQAHQQWADHHAEDEASCQAAGNSAQDCAQPEPTRADYGIEAAGYADVAGTSLQIGSIIAWLALFVIGGTAIGAEFTTGAIGNWLTFVPRRGQVLTSKILALVGLSVLIGAVLAALALAAPAVLVSVHGGTVELAPKLVYQALRGIGIGAAVACVGFVLALLTRHTVGALGFALGYLVVLFVRSSVLSSVGWAQRLTPWVPEANIAAVFNKGYEYQVPVPTRDPDGMQSLDFVSRTVSLEHGLIYTAVALAVLLALSAVVFLRRDVN